MTDRIRHIEAWQEEDSNKLLLSQDAAWQAHEHRGELLSTIRGLQEENERLRSENARLKLADMFWDANDPERPFDCVEDLLYEQDYEGEGVVDVQRAIALPNTAYHYKFRDRPDTDDTKIDLVQLTDEQYRGMRACEAVGRALRAMWDARVTRKAEELFIQYRESQHEARSAMRFSSQTYSVREAFKRQARVSLQGQSHDD